MVDAQGKTYENPGVMSSHSNDISHFFRRSLQSRQADMLHSITMAMGLSLLDSSVVEADDGRMQVEIDV